MANQYSRASKCIYFDINVILSNILDNALNALNKVTQPVLYIYIKYDRGILCIDIKIIALIVTIQKIQKTKLTHLGNMDMG